MAISFELKYAMNSGGLEYGVHRMVTLQVLISGDVAGMTTEETVRRVVVDISCLNPAAWCAGGTGD